jgi:hypothetical protein
MQLVQLINRLKACLEIKNKLKKRAAIRREAATAQNLYTTTTKMLLQSQTLHVPTTIKIKTLPIQINSMIIVMANNSSNKIASTPKQTKILV